MIQETTTIHRLKNCLIRLLEKQGTDITNDQCDTCRVSISEAHCTIRTHQSVRRNGNMQCKTCRILALKNQFGGNLLAQQVHQLQAER